MLILTSGQVVLNQNSAVGQIVVESYDAPARFAPDRFAPDRFAPVRFAPVRFALNRFAPYKFGLDRLVLVVPLGERSAPKNYQ